MSGVSSLLHSCKPTSRVCFSLQIVGFVEQELFITVTASYYSVDAFRNGNDVNDIA